MNFNRYKAKYSNVARPANLPISYWWTCLFGVYFFYELYAYLNMEFVLSVSIFSALLIGVIDIVTNTLESLKKYYMLLSGLLFAISLITMMYLLSSMNNHEDAMLYMVACFYFGGILLSHVYEHFK